MANVPIFEVQRREPTAAYRTALVEIVSGSDYVTPKTGFSVSTKGQLLKPGGTSAASNGNLTAVDATNHPGLAKIVFTQTEVNTLGDTIYTFSAGNYWGRIILRVVAYSPILEGSLTEQENRRRRGTPSA